MLRHLQNGVDRLLLGGVDERAGVDDDDVGVFGARGDLRSALREQAHHHLAVHQVLGTAQADKPNFLGAAAYGSSSSMRGIGAFWDVQQGYRIVFRVHGIFLFYHREVLLRLIMTAPAHATPRCYIGIRRALVPRNAIL